MFYEETHNAERLGKQLESGGRHVRKKIDISNTLLITSSKTTHDDIKGGRKYQKTVKQDYKKEKI